MPLDYEKEFRNAYAKNRAEAGRATIAGKLDRKIENFCKLHGFEIPQVKRAIQSNEIVAAFFAINPNKQNLFEKVAATFIRQLPGVKEFKHLATTELYIISGEVMSSAEVKSQRPMGKIAKTIDFSWKYDGMEFYAAHKYTKESGGAQGNQYHDLQNFVTEANLSEHETRRFVAIADGAFYAMKNGIVGMSRIRKLQQMATNPHVHACTINELASVMTKTAKK